MTEGRWYVAYTQPGKEIKVADLLARKKIKCYCPVNEIDGQFTHGKKRIFKPLFPNYIFTHLTDPGQLALKRIPGLISFVYWRGDPAVIGDDEIAAIKYFTNEYPCVKLEKTPIRQNQNPQVINASGFLLKGNVPGTNTNTISVILPTLGHSLVAEVSPARFTEVSYFKNEKRDVAV